MSIEYLEAPKLPKLRDAPMVHPTPAQKAIVAAVNVCHRAGIMPPEGAVINFRTVAGGARCNEQGLTGLWPDGSFMIFIDVDLPPARLAWIVIHETAHVAFGLDPKHRAYREQRIHDAAELQRGHADPRVAVWAVRVAGRDVAPCRDTPHTLKSRQKPDVRLWEPLGYHRPMFLLRLRTGLWSTEVVKSNETVGIGNL